jgi:hypothetical protein
VLIPAPFSSSGLAYIIGLVFYAFHWPECQWPGKFDRWGMSHNVGDQKDTDVPGDEADSIAVACRYRHCYHPALPGHLCGSQCQIRVFLRYAGRGHASRRGRGEGLVEPDEISGLVLGMTILLSPRRTFAEAWAQVIYSSIIIMHGIADCSMRLMLSGSRSSTE